MTDREVAGAMARSFLGKLPSEVVLRLTAEGERTDNPAGTTFYQEGSAPRAALVVTGLIRVYMASSEGRQVTVRYARNSDVLGIALIVGGPLNVSAQTLAPSSLFNINSRALIEAAREDARVAYALAEELNRRLDDTLQQTAINAFGSVKQRVASHLLDLASAQQRPEARLVAQVSQQERAASPVSSTIASPGSRWARRTRSPRSSRRSGTRRATSRAIGIDLEVEPLPFEKFNKVVLDPMNHVPVTLSYLVARDYPNGSAVFLPYFYGPFAGDAMNYNVSRVGATPEQLRSWGYSVTSVPSVDEKIEECIPLMGSDQVSCWAEVDKLLMEEVVPFAPYLFADCVVAVSPRVANYTVDQFTTFPAPDHMAVAESQQ